MNSVQLYMQAYALHSNCREMNKTHDLEKWTDLLKMLLKKIGKRYALHFFSNFLLIVCSLIFKSFKSNKKLEISLPQGIVSRKPACNAVEINLEMLTDQKTCHL